MCMCADIILPATAIASTQGRQKLGGWIIGLNGRSHLGSSPLSFNFEGKLITLGAADFKHVSQERLIKGNEYACSIISSTFFILHLDLT